MVRDNRIPVLKYEPTEGAVELTEEIMPARWHDRSDVEQSRPSDETGGKGAPKK